MIFSELLKKKYEFVRTLGKGAMGEVDLARDLTRGNLVAIKSVLASSFADEEAQLRFLREARITSALSHPNIIRVIDQGKDIGRLYIVLEYVDGGGLGERLRSRGPLKANEFCEMAVSVLDAVAYAHRSKVLHRDLKTDNILLDHDQVPRIADFGLAKGIDDAGLETVSGTMMGTPVYMAPELARGERATEKTDQYALGVVLYQMLCARPPLFADNPLDMLQKHIEEIPKPVTFHRPEVPQALADAVLRALSKKAEDRWPDVATLRDVVNAQAHTASGGWGAPGEAARSSAGQPRPATVASAAVASSTAQRKSRPVPALKPLPSDDDDVGGRTQAYTTTAEPDVEATVVGQKVAYDPNRPAKVTSPHQAAASHAAASHAGAPHTGGQHSGAPHTGGQHSGGQHSGAQAKGGQHGAAPHTGGHAPPHTGAHPAVQGGQVAPQTGGQRKASDWTPSAPQVLGEKPDASPAAQPVPAATPPAASAPAVRASPPRWAERLLVAILLVALFVVGSKPGGKAASVEDFAKLPVRGALGTPLGHVVTVVGTALDASSTRRKSDEGLVLLSIDSVNGQGLPRPVVVPFNTPAWAPVPAPKPGKRFRLQGYETGSFAGVPEDAMKVTNVVPASAPFAWSVDFEVLKDLDAKR